MKENGRLVLILVLMEDTLRALEADMTQSSTSVLILVLMEDTLRDGSFSNHLLAKTS